MNKKEHLQGTRDIHLYIFIYSYTVKTNLYTFFLDFTFTYWSQTDKSFRTTHTKPTNKNQIQTKATEQHVQYKKSYKTTYYKPNKNKNKTKATELHVQNQQTNKLYSTRRKFTSNTTHARRRLPKWIPEFTHSTAQNDKLNSRVLKRE